MANADTPFGLRPIRYRDGSPYNGAANPYYIRSDYATALFIGDPVIKTTDGNNAAQVAVPGAGTFPVGTLPTINKATAGDTNAISGVIVGFAPLPTDLTKQYNPASTERVAYVVDDPNVVFEVQADSATDLAVTSYSANFALVYTHSGDTATGLSGAELDGSSEAQDASLQLIALRAVNREDNDGTATHAKVEVVISNHTESSNWGSAATNEGTLGI